MNRGLLIKAVLESWRATALFAAGVLVFETILWAVLPTFHGQLQDQLMQIPFLQNVMRVMTGVDVGDELGPMLVGTLAWTHPVILVLFWAHETVFCTRMPVGEIDRGTVDVLLGLPVSRWQAYVTETIVWLASGGLLVSMALLGSWLGSHLAPERYHPGIGPQLLVAANLFALYLLVGGVAYLASACSERRSRAVGITFGYVIASFFLHALAQFWSPIEPFAILGFMYHYLPFEILQSGTVPVQSIAVLAVAGAICWACGGWIFSRRDICTV